MIYVDMLSRCFHMYVSEISFLSVVIEMIVLMGYSNKTIICGYMMMMDAGRRRRMRDD